MLILYDLGCLSFLLALFLTPMARNAAQRLGIIDRPDQTRKFHGRPVPRLGGVAIAASYLLCGLYLAYFPYRESIADVPAAVLAMSRLMPAAMVALATGVLDDVFGLRPWQKLAGQTLAATLAYMAGFGVYILQGNPLSTWLSIPLSLLWLVGCMNAVNLVDGMDGLAAGVGFFATVTTLIAALIHQNLELAIVTVPMAGALLGFLRYNFNPASIFLGDSGSLLVGLLLGCYAALWSQKSATMLGMAAPLMALAIPLLETSLSILRRALRNRPVFGADAGHIHHKLLEQGLTPRRAALLLYGVCALAAVLSLLHETAYNRFGGLVIVLFCGASWIGIQHLGYAELGLAGRALVRGTLRGIIDFQIRLQEFERALSQAGNLEEQWEVIRHGCKEFGLSGVRLKVQSRVFEEYETDATDKPTLQLRVPLPDSQYVNLYCQAGLSLHPMALSAVGRAIETVLRGRVLPIQSEVKDDHAKVAG